MRLKKETSPLKTNQNFNIASQVRRFSAFSQELFDRLKIMKNNQMLITIIVAVVVAAVSFFGGMKYQQSQGRNSLLGGQFQRGLNGQFGRNGSGRATLGDIVSLDSNNITVKMQNGTSKIANLSGTTIYSKTDIALKSDLKTGEKVAVFGTENSDGSITAQNVQLNPRERFISPLPTR